MLREKDKQDVRSGMLLGVGTLIVTAAASAFAAIWASIQKADPFVIVMLVAIAGFLGFFAIGLFLDWRLRHARPHASASGNAMSSNANALVKLRLLRKVGVNFLKQGNALPYLGSTPEAQQQYVKRLEQQADTWDKMVLGIQPETHGADNEWDRFDTLGNMTMDTISQMIDRLDEIIARLDSVETDRKRIRIAS